MSRSDVRSRAARWLAVAAWIYGSALIVSLASERVYWYWAGFNPSSIFEIAAFYLIPTSVALVVLAMLHGTEFRHVVLAGALYAVIVEGVLTAIIYGDGPAPVLALMFVGWHGMLAFVLFWYLIRRWLLDGRIVTLALTSAGAGVVWGAWASSSIFIDQEGVDGATQILDPAGFALYAIGVGVVLAVSHWLIGFVWPESWRPSPAAKIVTGAAAAICFAFAVVPAVPWAPVKLVALVGGTAWLIRIGSGERRDQRSMVDALAGRVRLWDTLTVLAMPATAMAVYAAMWSAGMDTPLQRGLYWSLVVAQIAVGLGAFVWAAVTTVRASRSQERSAVDLDG